MYVLPCLDCNCDKNFQISDKSNQITLFNLHPMFSEQLNFNQTTKNFFYPSKKAISFSSCIRSWYETGIQNIVIEVVYMKINII